MYWSLLLFLPQLSFAALNCNEGRTCIYAKPCDGEFSSTCPVALSYRVKNDLMELELAGRTPSINHKYIALAFAEQPKMQNTFVTECSSFSDTGLPAVKLSYNPPEGYANERIDDDQMFRATIQNANVTYEDGVLHCKWSQKLEPQVSDKIFKNKKGIKYFFLLAYGNTRDDGLRKHEWAEATSLHKELKAKSAFGLTLKKAHAALMVFGWLFCMPVAVLFARFLRAHWPSTRPYGLNIWFHVHRTLNFTGCVCLVIGFMCAWWAAGWKWKGIGSEAPLPMLVHATVGLTSIILACSQPVNSLFRCKPTESRRRLFNVVHRWIGIVSFLLAILVTVVASNSFATWGIYRYRLVFFSVLPLFVLIGAAIAMTVGEQEVKRNGWGMEKVKDIRWRNVKIATVILAIGAIVLIYHFCSV